MGPLSLDLQNTSKWARWAIMAANGTQWILEQKLDEGAHTGPMCTMGPKGPNGGIRAQWTLMSMGRGSQMWPSERKSKETRGIIQETGVLSTPIQR